MENTNRLANTVYAIPSSAYVNGLIYNKKVFANDGITDLPDTFEEFIEISVIPSMYDCTGQAFTNWYKIFKRRGQFWAYHSVVFDV